MKKIYSAILMMFVVSQLSGQLFTPDSSVPPGTDWQQINTDTVRLVFPKGLENQANRIVNMVHHLAANNRQSIGNNFRKTDIFLLNQTVIANGYVATAPFHSKFYTNFPQRSFFGSTDWLDILTIHEYRHALQFSNTLHGVTKWAYYLTGEAAWGTFFSLAIPPWFFEGDAVMQETALSYAGRGRIKNFSAELRTIAGQVKPFGYEKMVNGSYKDFIPDHYVLGYDLVRFGRQQYGNDIWAGIFKDAAAYKGGFYPFSKALKKRTGMRTPTFYQTMMESTRSQEFTNNMNTIYQSPIDKSDPHTYSKPRYQSADKLIAIRESFKDVAQFVQIDLKSGDETPIIPVGFGLGEYDVNDQIMVWSEIALDPRWSDRSYSNIWKYEFTTGSTTKITDKTKFFAPVISPDGKKILVIEVNELLQNSIKIMDVSTGNISKEIPNPEGYNFRFPEWNGNYQVAIVAQKNNLNAIFNINLNSGEYKLLIPFSTPSFEDLSIIENKLFFLASEGRDNGLNDVMSYHLITGQLSLLPIKTPFLTDMPEAGPNGQIALVNTEFNQKRILVLKRQEGKPFAEFNKGPNMINERHDEALVPIIRSENGPIVDQIPLKQFPVKKYHPGLSRLTLHTWLLNPGVNDVSIILAANDKLGKYGLEWSPGYNFNENVFFSDINMTIGNWLPLFKIGYNSLINRSRLITGFEGDLDSWNESRIYGTVSIPLNYIKRNYRYGFNPVLGYGVSMLSANNYFEKDVFHTGFIQLQGSATRKKAYRSIKAPYSFDTDWTFSKTLNNDDKINISGNLRVNLPGLMATHFTQLIFDYNYSDLNNEYHPLNNSYNVRGFGAAFASDQFFSPKINYGFPIWYPDIAIGPLVYFKRVRANLFYDLGFDWDFTQTNKLRQLQSAGIELLFDNRYLRIAELSMGVRAGYKLVAPEEDTEKFFITFVLDAN